MSGDDDGIRKIARMAHHAFRNAALTARDELRVMLHEQTGNVEEQLMIVRKLETRAGVAAKYATYELYTTDFAHLPTLEEKVEAAVEVICAAAAQPDH